LSGFKKIGAFGNKIGAPLDIRSEFFSRARPRTHEFEAAAMPYLNDLYRTAVHLLGSAAGAEDVIQDGLALPHTLHGRQQFAEFQQ
jgi:hypothetical protein